MSKAVERALSILIFIGKSEHHPTMSNICEELNIPKASASDLLHTLMDYGFVRMVDADRKTLALGEQTLQLGSAYRHQTGYLDVVHGAAKALSAEMGKTIFFWIYQQGKMVLMERALSRTGIYPNAEIGHMEPMDSLIGQVYTSRQKGQEQMADQPIQSFAVPLFDVDGRIAGVISTYELVSRMTEAEAEQVMQELEACAEATAGKIYAGF